jgi:hypothetical protein
MLAWLAPERIDDEYAGRDDPPHRAHRGTVVRRRELALPAVDGAEPPPLPPRHTGPARVDLRTVRSVA